MSITEIAINGTPVDLANVEWALAIDHGRNDISTPPQASTAELIIRNFTTIPATIADVLTIESYNTERFTGIVTDTEITHEYSNSGTPVGRLRITAMGNMVRLAMYSVGDAGYAEETLDDRVNAILTATGVTYTANTEPLMVLLAQDPGNPQTAFDALIDLCVNTGATMCDLPDGSILFESYTRRGLGYNPATWADVSDIWDDVDYVWSDVYEATSTVPVPVELPNDGIVWEPVWRQSIVPVINEAIVNYGDPVTGISFTDNTSVGIYGLRTATINTTLADTTDAYDRASHIVTTQAYPRYGLTQIQVYMNRLDSGTRSDVLGLIQGSRVLVNNLPQPAPLGAYLGVVEGWSESYTPQGYFLTLSISDPRYSYAVCSWSDVDAALEWGDVDGTIQWYDVVLPGDLVA